jgi:hypothetical protein
MFKVIFPEFSIAEIKQGIGIAWGLFQRQLVIVF